MENLEKLKILYAQKSKHSNYQILSKRLSLIIGENEIEVKTRYESERLKYILKSVDVKGKKILDIGGNTGYFSFQLIDNGAQKLHFYEGNKVHSNFVQLAANVLKVEDKIKITNDYFSFNDDLGNKKYDVIFLLNVLHHLGDDYGNKEISIELAKQKIIKQLNSLANKTSLLVFQLGFNWKGDCNLGLFEKGTKSELIDFIISGIKNYWTPIKIGIAEVVKNGIEYFDMNKNNIVRDDSLGEFLNRPIFILQTLK